MKRAVPEANHERIFGILRKASGPMTAYEVLGAARKHNISAPPTVYRALNRLINEGRAHRLETLNSYVACTDQHHGHGHGSAVFAICSDCGQVEEIHEDGSLKKLLAKADARGFKVDQAVIELKGHCGACADAPK